MNKWQKDFRNRMYTFANRNQSSHDALPMSIKVRVNNGCFHREHSPYAYEMIDQCLDSINPEEIVEFEEHESGPELLVFIAATTAGISLAKSIIDLITAIIKARSDGIKKGDHPQAPLELIVRRIQKNEQFEEEIVLRIGHQEDIKPEVIEECLNKSLSTLLKKDKRKRK